MSNFCHFKEQSLWNLTSAFQHQTYVCSFPDLCWQFMSQLKCAWEVQIVVAQLCSYFYFPLGEMMSNFCSFLEYSPQNLTSAFQKKTQMCLFPDLCQQFLSIKSKCSWFNKFLLLSFVVIFICHFSQKLVFLIKVSVLHYIPPEFDYSPGQGTFRSNSQTVPHHLFGNCQ